MFAGILSERQRAALGSAVIGMAELEHYLDLVIPHLANLTQRRYEVLAQGAMLGRKLEILRAIGSQNLRSQRRKTAFKRIMDELEALNAERVVLVHGAWGAPGGGIKLYWLAGYPIAEPIEAMHRNRGGRIRTIRAEDISAISDRIERAHRDLARFWIDIWITPNARRANRRAARREGIPAQAQTP